MKETAGRRELRIADRRLATIFELVVTTAEALIVPAFFNTTLVTFVKRAPTTVAVELVRGCTTEIKPLFEMVPAKVPV